MSDDLTYDSTTFRVLSSREQDIVKSNLQLFSQLRIYRDQGFSGQWEEVAELIEPSFRNTFMFGSYNSPGVKKTDRQVDATAMMANSRFAAICDSLLTPSNSMYQRFTASDDYVMKDHQTRLYFEQIGKIIFRERYMPEANFAAQNVANWRSLGAFGNHGMFVDDLDDPYNPGGLRYTSIPLGDLYFYVDHQNRVVGFIRVMRMTASQAEKKWPGQLPPQLHSAYRSQSQSTFVFLHCVLPRGDEYDPQRLDAKGKRWQSVYMSLEGQCLMFKKGADLEGGYRTFPLAVGRYDQAPNEVYGRGWAMAILPAAKTLNAEKKMYLKVGHRAADPVLLTHEDGLIGASLRPGALNPGGVNSDGKPLVHILPTGELQISEEMMEEERKLINDAALVNLFQILVKTPQMSATEVIERANEKGILLAPVLGRQTAEYIGSMTHRELDLLAYQGRLPQMPPRLKEAQGSYHILYDNPLSRMAKAGASAGFMRTVESVKELVAVSGDASLLDPFNFNVAIPAIAEQNAVPESWMSSPQEIQQKAVGRAKAQAKDQALKALPNQAAMVKAQAFAAKNNPQGAQPQQEQQGGQ